MVAVITGDIISSSQLNEDDRKQILKKIIGIKAYNSHLLAAIHQKPEIFRGDAFQLLVIQPEKALQIAVFMRLWMKTLTNTLKHRPGRMIVDCRLAIGIGHASPLSEKISEADGEAFRNSGPVLDKMQDERIKVKTPWQSMNEEWDSSMHLLDFIITGLSINQSEALMYKIEGATQDEIAKQLNISQSAVHQRLQSAGSASVFTAIDRFKKQVEAYLKTIN